jgi:putative oxygen-independent coproporphyrinogen III oxidase
MTTLDLLRRLGQQPSHRRLTAHSAQGRRVEWREEPGFGVYVHIPFCRHRCHYCDFNTYEGQDELHESYVAALIADILRTSHTDRPATSVFFGGGTPTLLPPEALVRILRAIEERIGLAPEAEVTTEANPETVDARYFERLLDGGFNRFSLGMQSMAPNVLEGLGRTHSGERALGALTDARRAGASDVNLDLIYGSVWERPGDWERTLHGVIAAGPDHVSAYALTIEEGTPLGTLVATGRVPDVDPDVQAERYEVAHSILAAAGYEHYEISNWARPGRTCDHNLLYWSEGDYLGFGAGAHGHLSGRDAGAGRAGRRGADARHPCPRGRRSRRLRTPLSRRARRPRRRYRAPHVRGVAGGRSGPAPAHDEGPLPRQRSRCRLALVRPDYPGSQAGVIAPR